MEIPDIIRMMVTDKFSWNAAILCQVIDVSGSTCNVTAIEQDIELKSVRLQAQAGNGVLIKPALNSFVLCAPINGVEFAVIMYSDVDQITLLDGSYGGLIKINDLITKVNNLENQVNDLLTALQGVVVPLAPSGTYPFAPLFTSFTPLTPTIISDIENNKILHGTP